jgi:mono/diheme cytochrome c family protein
MLRHNNLFLALAIILLTAGAAKSGQVERGRKLYLEHCAVCHGAKGEGDGPMAKLLTTPPANLRLLSERYGNPLPAGQIAGFIDGRADIAAHGPRDMPVWGSSAWDKQPGSGEPGQLTPAVASLVAYLHSIQLSTHRVASLGRNWNFNQP